MKHPAVQRAENDEAILAVIFAAILHDQRFSPEKNWNDFVKIDPVLFDISPVLLFIPFEH
jgi:hypothetical protein